MGFDVRLILLSYRHLCLVACPSLSVLCQFVGGGDLFCPSFILWDGGADLTHPRMLLGTCYEACLLESDAGNRYVPLVEH